MTRRTFLLMGIAIAAVAISHAAGYGQIAMINWADRYRPVTIPNYDAVGSLSYFILLIIRQLLSFAVPAFLFCSGFFVAYATRGSRGRFTWTMVRVRIIDLLIPYLLWSIAWFFFDAVQGKTYTLTDYAQRLITGKADSGGYFFIPLLCQFYFLSPLLLPLAKKRPHLLVAVAALVQLIAFGIQYAVILKANGPVLSAMTWLIDSWLFFAWILYFALGMVFGLHLDRIKPILLRLRAVLVGALIVLIVPVIFEAEIIYWTTGQDERFVPFTISTVLYSVVFITAFLAFEKVRIPAMAAVQQLGNKSYGIYLTHNKVMEFCARVIRQIAPWMLAYQVVLFSPLILILGLSIPLLLMNLTIKLPVRKYYHYLFG